MSIENRTVGLALLVAVGLGDHLSAQTSAQREKERLVMLTVGTYLERGHVSGQSLDDTISSRAYKRYLEMLDPMKFYFNRSDVEGFSSQEEELDDMVRAGDARFANMVFDLLLERIGERVDGVEDLLGEEYDFTLDESFVIDPEAVAYAADEAAWRARWRRRIKYDLLSMTADGVVDEEARDRLRRRYTGFEERMKQNTRNDVLGLFLNAVTTTYDPHTTYLSPKGFEDLEMQLTLNYQGIGALLQERDGYAMVERVLSGGAAEKDGKLKAGDRIVSVGQGEDGEMVDIVGMRLSDVVKLIRGEEGSLVRLGVEPQASGQVQIYGLVRARTELRDSAATGEVFEAGTKPDGSTLSIGVIDLPSFYIDSDGARQGRPDFISSTRDTAKILEEFKEQGVDVAVLDLRWNGGGPLSEAVGVTGLFIDTGPVVQVSQMNGSVLVHQDRESGMAWGGPLVVMTSKLSASASEIVAGAIVDYRRGLTVGDSATHGKGSVQTIVGLGAPENGALKLTIQKFYRPSGLSTQLRGVRTDVEIPSLTDGMADDESDLPYALPFDRIDPVPFRRYRWISPEMKRNLREASETRSADSDVFSAIRDDIVLYSELNDRTEVTLNLEKYLELQTKFETSRARQRELRELVAGGGANGDAYLGEVLDIAKDYLNLLRDRGQVR